MNFGTPEEQNPPVRFTQLSKPNLLTFWFPPFGPFLVEVPQGSPFISGSFGQLSLCSGHAISQKTLSQQQALRNT